MANVKVIYQSRGRKTQKVMEEVAKVCDVEAMDISEPHTLGEADLLFIGMGTYAGHPDNNLLTYLDNLPANSIKGAAIVCLSATEKDYTHYLVNVLEHKGITIYPVPLLLKGQFFMVARNHPNEEDFEKARAYAKEVMEAFQED